MQYESKTNQGNTTYQSYEGKVNCDIDSCHDALNERYQNIHYIDEGSQGTLFVANDKDMNQVAIKVFDLQTAKTLKDIELFEREIETLKNLQIHGVPKYIESIKTDKYYYLVEEYIDASSLKHQIKEGKRFKFEEVCTILLNILQILIELESCIPPVIHRDIKPSNILVSSALTVTLVDFGVVAARHQKTFSSTFAGTAGYLAPEQLYGKVTPAADIFSLGMTMIHLLTSVAPIDMEMDGLIPKFKELLPIDIPKEFVDLLSQMIEPNPKERIQNGAELLQKLQMLNCIQAIKSDQSSPKETNKHSGLKRTAKNTLLILGAILIIPTLFLLFRFARVIFYLIPMIAIIICLIKLNKK